MNLDSEIVIAMASSLHRQTTGTFVVLVSSGFRCLRQAQCRDDLADNALVSEYALVGEKGKLFGSCVEHHPPPWRFLVFHIGGDDAALLELGSKPRHDREDG
jgi:hypothetical protein